MSLVIGNYILVDELGHLNKGMLHLIKNSPVSLFLDLPPEEKNYANINSLLFLVARSAQRL
jgi:hypothetical protein